jgi:hypothetical protein
MLVRRLKERCAAPGVIHVGTSATTVAHPKASAGERRRAVAELPHASLDSRFGMERVIEETLSPSAEGEVPSRERPLPLVFGDSERVRDVPKASAGSMVGIRARRWVRKWGGALKRRTRRYLACRDCDS